MHELKRFKAVEISRFVDNHTAQPKITQSLNELVRLSEPRHNVKELAYTNVVSPRQARGHLMRVTVSNVDDA